MIDKFLNFLGWDYIQSYRELCEKYSEYEHIILPEEFPVWVTCSGVLPIVEGADDFCYNFEFLYISEIEDFKKENNIS